MTSLGWWRQIGTQGRAAIRAIGCIVCLGSVGCDASSQNGGSSCTLIGCDGGLRIDFTRSAWPAGNYSVFVVMDANQQALCQVKLPMSPTESAGICNAEDVLLATSGQMLPANQQSILGVRINGVPKTVNVTIKRDGQTELAADVTPTYVTSQPNGPGCEPTCTQATAQLPVP
jgi:hypothetical protein